MWIKDLLTNTCKIFEYPKKSPILNSKIIIFSWNSFVKTTSAAPLVIRNIELISYYVIVG